MKTNAAGLELIRQFEGLRLEAYRCPAGILTIGYGDTQNVKEGDVITREDAENRLLARLEEFEKGVTRLVKVPITEDQFASLVSFSYNVGLENFKRSTLLNCINKIQWRDAAKEFLRWNKAGHKVLAGLTRRREAESALFSSMLGNI